MKIGKGLYSLVLFLALSVVGGVLSAGLIFPVISLATTSSSEVASFITDFSEELQMPSRMAESSKLLNADGTLLANFYDYNRVYKTLDEIAPIMITAQTAIEDHRFYEHGAIDLQGTLRALVSTSQGVTQGGSSITQQYVRLLLIAEADSKDNDLLRELATENTMARKVRELRYAIGLEKKYTKDQILEGYLNISYYGAGAYGVEAAARRYFGVHAKELTLSQAAMLAGLVRNPVATNPITHPEIGVGRRNDVLNRMAELNVITKEEATAAKAEPYDKSKGVESPKGCANSKYPFICDFAENTIINEATSLGKTKEERKNRLYNGGLIIKTTIDLKLQKKSEKTIAKYVNPKDPAIAVIDFIEPGTGKILAMAQSRTKQGRKNGQTYWNYSVTNDMGGADGFHAGSTFKAFVVAAGLEEGYGAFWTTNVSSPMNFKGTTFKSCDGSWVFAKDWNVRGGTGTQMNVFQAATRSINGFFVQYEAVVGLCPVTKMAKRLGLKLANGEDIVENYHNIPSFTLGAAGISPLSMAEAYATFAARGIHCDPIILSSIKNVEGTTFKVPSANCKRILQEEIADGVNAVLQGPMNSGTARYAKVPGVQMAGKTGTVTNNLAIWTVGYNPALAGAALLSIDNNPKFQSFWSHRNGLGNVVLPISHTYIQGYSGINVGGWLLKPTFETGIKDRKPGVFHQPPQSLLRGKQVSVPNCTGMTVEACRSVLRGAGFSSHVNREKVFSEEENDRVANLNPSRSASQGSMIDIVVSKGPEEVAEEEEEYQSKETGRPAVNPGAQPPLEPPEAAPIPKG